MNVVSDPKMVGVIFNFGGASNLGTLGFARAAGGFGVSAQASERLGVFQ